MCSIPEFIIYIEKQWLPGMNWNNYSYGISKWDIDYIISCSFFNLLDPVKQYMCFRWQNQCPMWWEDNLLKSNTIIKHKIL